MLNSKMMQASAAAVERVYETITLVDSRSRMLDLHTPVNFQAELSKDDLVLLHYIAIDDLTVTHPAGYTVVPIFTLDGGRDQAWYAYKKMGDIPDTSFSIADIGGGSDGLALTYYVFRGVDRANPFDTPSVGAQSINPPSITTVTDNSVVLVTTFASGGASRNVTGQPSGYSDLRWVNATAGNDAVTASALKFVNTAGTEDPGEFTFDSASNDYYSIVHALRPRLLPIQEATFIGSSTTSNGSPSVNLTINTPAGAQAGDLLIAAVGTDGNAGTWTAPSYWVEIDYENSNGPALWVGYRLTGSSPASDYTFTQSTSAVLGGTIVCYRNARFSNKTTFARVTAGSGETPLTLPSVYANSVGELVNLMFTVADGDTLSISPTDQTIVYHDTSSPNFIVTRTEVSQGDTGTKTFDGLNMNSNGKDGLSMTLNAYPPPAVRIGTRTSLSISPSTSLTTPIGTQDGDLMIAAAIATSGGAATWTTPSGWTEVAQQGSEPNLTVWYRVASSDTGVSHSFESTIGNIAVGIITLRNVDYRSIGAFGTSTSLSTTAPSVETANGFLAIFGASGSGNNWSTPTGMITRLELDGATSTLEFCTNSSLEGQTGDITSTYNGTNNGSAGILVALNPIEA